MGTFHFKHTILPLIFLLIFIVGSTSSTAGQQFRGWDTNFTEKSIHLNEFKPGGPPKDGIPSIDDPTLITQKEADSWLTCSGPLFHFS